MDLELAGLRAVVTGASRGIGKSVAFELAREGVELAICARNEDALQETAEEINHFTGRTIYAVAADTTDTDSVEKFFDGVNRELGGLDILVNNAAAPGGLVSGPLETADPQSLLADIDTKVVGYLRCAKVAAPFFKQQGWGRIINIGGLAGRSGGAISGMRNLALTHLTKTLSNELGPHGITVNIVHPGITRTERTATMQEAEATALNISVAEVERRAGERVDIRRIVDSGEVANLVVFLVSSKASAITGESIAIGGGVGSAVFQ